jgi:hypothetical protein
MNLRSLATADPSDIAGIFFKGRIEGIITTQPRRQGILNRLIATGLAQDKHLTASHILTAMIPDRCR